MRLNKNFNTQSSLRFTRWSRVGYAIFRSLSSAVSIGFLANSIADSSLNTTIQNSITHLFISNSDIEDISNETKPQVNLNNLDFLLNTVSLQESNAVHQSKYFFQNTHKTVKTDIYLS
jgi:hypothetical protein